MDTQTIIITSKNPVKKKAAQEAFAKMFPDQQFFFKEISVSSGVSDQPKTSQETYQGAFNRIQHAQKLEPEADFWVGLEGGIEDSKQGMESFGWALIQSKDVNVLGKSKTATFYLPTQIAELIKAGKELGEADDIVFGMTNSKQERGAIGILTDMSIDRTEFYREALILALIPFKNPKLY